jgi:hypothetical protein
MKHAVASHTDTEFVDNFIAPEGLMVCKMDLDVWSCGQVRPSPPLESVWRLHIPFVTM